MDIRSYQGSFNIRNFNFVKSTLVVIFFIVVLFFVICFNDDFYDYYNGYGILNDSDELSILVSVRDLEKITGNDKIIIERTTFAYRVTSISEDNIEYGTDILKKISLKIDLPEYLNIDNNYINYKIITGKDSILNYFIRTIKGE